MRSEISSFASQVLSRLRSLVSRPRPETLLYRPERLTAQGLKGFFADVLVTLDAHPRPVEVRVDAPPGPDAVIDFGDGNPVFAVLSDGRRPAGEIVAAADFRRRWLAEHPVPLVLRGGRAVRLALAPADANRIRVRMQFPHGLW